MGKADGGWVSRRVAPANFGPFRTIRRVPPRSAGTFGALYSVSGGIPARSAGKFWGTCVASVKFCNLGPKCRYLRKTRPEVQVSIFCNSPRKFAGESDGVAERPAKKKGSKGLPKGIIEHRSSKLQARLSYKGEGGKTKQKFIPGLFDDIPAAVAAQAAAYQVLSSAGPLAVWPNDSGTKPARNKRGEVRTSRSPGLHRVLSA